MTFTHAILFILAEAFVWCLVPLIDDAQDIRGDDE